MKQSAHLQQWFQQIPNQLTLARMATVPVLLTVFPFAHEREWLRVICAYVFAGAAVTDILDGYFARKYKLQSNFGALLDPIADKILVAAALLLLVEARFLFPLLAGLMLCRDIAVSGIRLMALERKVHIHVSWLGKVKTILQDVSIFCLMINTTHFDIDMRVVGMLCFWAGLIASYVSAFQYGREFLAHTKTVEASEPELE